MQQRDRVGAGGRLLPSGLDGWLLWSPDSGLPLGHLSRALPTFSPCRPPAQGAERGVLPLELAGGH